MRTVGISFILFFYKFFSKKVQTIILLKFCEVFYINVRENRTQIKKNLTSHFELFSINLFFTMF